LLKKYYKYEFLELQAISFDELKKRKKTNGIKYLQIIK